MRSPSRNCLALLVPLACAAGLRAAPPQAPARTARGSVEASGANTAKAARAPKAIVVGWDGADWELLDPLLERGLLPNLKGLLGEGRQARLSTYRPRASPLLWTTLATGLSPLEHGVADFQEYDVATKSVLPISGRSRRVPALWNVASAKGRSVGVVGWWATWPAEVVNGFFVSDRASPVLFDPDTLSKSPALTWPPELAEGVRILGARLGRPPFEEVAKYLHLTKAEFDAATAQERGVESPVTGFRRILGSTSVYARTATDLWDKKKPDLLMVYFEGTDEVGHLLARYHPPRLEGVTDEEFQRYGEAVSLYYREADRILGELARRAKESGAVLVLVSDHGFRWGSDRPASFSASDVNTAYLWHNPFGVLVAAGPGVAPSPERGTADVFDVVPLLCRLLGLPADPRMPGAVPKGFLSSAAPKAVPAAAWAKLAPVKRAAVTRDAAAEKKLGEEFTRKLISLGYLSGAPSAKGVAAEDGAVEVQMTPSGVSNLGIYLAEKGRDAEAIPYFRRAIAADSSVPIYHVNLADALDRLGRFAEADEEALKAAALPGEDAVTRLLARAVKRAQGRRSEEARVLLEKASRTLSPVPFEVWDGLGRLDYDARRCREAEEIFRRLSTERPEVAGTWVMLARTRRCQGDAEGARAAYERALALAPGNDALRREAASGSR